MAKYNGSVGLRNFPHISLIIPYSREMNKPKEMVELLASPTVKAEKELLEK